MYTYSITAFENDGTLLLNDTFEAQDDASAKKQGLQRLSESGYAEKGSRITRSGRLIHFERCQLPTRQRLT